MKAALAVIDPERALNPDGRPVTLGEFEDYGGVAAVVAMAFNLEAVGGGEGSAEEGVFDSSGGAVAVWYGGVDEEAFQCSARHR